MPLVIVSGIPCSGKTEVSKKLKAYLEENHASYNVVHLNEECLNINKKEAYKNATEEKKARAAFMSAVQRQISKDTIVIADSMNYIKGYRYQLYCDARSSNTPHCALHVLCKTEEAREFNRNREQGYTEEAFNELVDRFEEPNNQTKWDSPLFCVSHNFAEESFEELAKSICTKKVKAPPSFATAKNVASSKDFVEILDRITQAVTDEILRQIKPFGPSTVTVTGLDEPLSFSRPISVSDLAGFRRQFIHMNRFHPIDSKDIPRLFAGYIMGTRT